MNTVKATDEVIVTNSSDWKHFDQISKSFSKAFGSQSLAVCDGLDEAYYDHDIDGTVVTVHLQHYLGVRIFLRHPDKASEKDLRVLKRIKEHYENAESSQPANPRNAGG